MQGGALRSFKVSNQYTVLISNLKLMCNFLLVLHCNYVHIFYRFGDIQRFLGEKAVFATFSHPNLV